MLHTHTITKDKAHLHFPVTMNGSKFTFVHKIMIIYKIDTGAVR